MLHQPNAHAPHSLDALGSTIRLVDGSGNKLVDYTYEAYGNTTADGVSNNPFQYTGRENDGAGLYYYRARYYSAALGRFISSDPIGLAGGINTYAYVGGNPLSYTDPLGLAPQDNWYGHNDKGFRDWAHQQKQDLGKRGDDNFTKKDLDDLYKEWKDLGEPRGKGGKSGKGGSQRGFIDLDIPNILGRCAAVGALIFTPGNAGQCEDPCKCGDLCR